jgi:hypothetical protein
MSDDQDFALKKFLDTAFESRDSQSFQSYVNFLDATIELECLFKIATSKKAGSENKDFKLLLAINCEIVYRAAEALAIEMKIKGGLNDEFIKKKIPHLLKEARRADDHGNPIGIANWEDVYNAFIFAIGVAESANQIGFKVQPVSSKMRH